GVDYLKITMLGFPMAALAHAMHAIILPLRVEELSGPAYKATYLGILTFAGLLTAMLVQPVAGAISDHTSSRIGRRKPFILAGILLALVFLFASGLVNNYTGLLIIWCFLQACLNVAQGPFQAYIPDLAPHNKRGQASGLKALLEICGGVALLSLIGRFMGRYSSGAESEWLWISLGLLGIFLAVAMILTVLTVREKIGRSQPLLWSSLWYKTFKVRLKTNSGFLLFMLSRLLFVMGLTTLQSFALYYFKDVVGAENPSKITADLITAVGISMLIVVFPAGRYSDRNGRRLILTLCGLIGAAGVALIFFTHDYGWIIFAGSLIGIAAGAFLSVNWALATDLIPSGQSAQYLGLANLASAGGAALARLIGPAIDFFNHFSPNLGYNLMLGACFFYFLLASLLIRRIKIPPSSGIAPVQT
ncbi:MAG TPA: MFS transporter, partial [Dehalococcoidales bacterium]|nr:MFS transporter [Dehalococcoidales bacterium]